MRIGLPGVLWCVLIAGCSPLEPPAPGPDHPANPRAAAAPDPALSDVLAIDESNLPRRPPEFGGGMSDGHREAGSPEFREPAAPGETSLTYTCPMHPRVSMDKPGRCPTCGMALQPKGGER